MFSASEQQVTSFESCWKTEQKNSEKISQTEPLETHEKNCQVLSNSDVGVQTEKEELPNHEFANYNEFKLLAFLQRIAPQVEKELKKSSRSRAFDRYSTLDEDLEIGVKRLHVLRWQDIPTEHIVMDIGWSSTGSVIGVCYGVGIHEDWCSHKGAVAVWNINRNEFAANSPDQVMEISTCATCLAFHPTNPAMLAVGNMAGEVMVYDLSRSQEVVPYLRGYSGGMSITRLKWVTIPTSGATEAVIQFKSILSLVSTTAEGTILVWNIQQSKETMALSSGYLVKSEDVPREMRPRLSDSGGVGLTSISFSLNDSSRFILGTEGGAVLLCSTLLMERSDQLVNGVGLNKCVTSSLYPHTGRVLQISGSKFHRHAVLSLGSDKSLRLHSLLQPNKPACVIHCEESMTCAEWVPSRPLVAAVGKIGGEISFFNFANKNCNPVLNLPAHEKTSPISSLVFNETNIKLIACGDHLGRVFIWELPANFISPPATEQSTLSNLVQILSE